MRLAVLIGRFPPGVVGGAEIQAEAWARRLAAAHEVTVLTRREPSGQSAGESRDGFAIRRFTPSSIPIWRTLSDLMRIRAAIRAMNPAPDVLLCFQTFISGLAGVLAAPRHTRVIVWIRGEGEYRLGHSRFLRWISPFVWRRASKVLVQSETNLSALTEQLRRHASAYADEILGKTGVVPNGLELPAPPFVRGRKVLAVGRLIPDKGMDLVIRATAEAGLPLTVAGDGPERRGLEALAVDLGADVEFKGALGRDALAKEYAAAGCVVLAARHGEGLPNVLLEAMSWARPVVATPVGGVADLVRHEQNGLLVEGNDAGSIRDALRRLADDAGLADRFGAGARATAEAFAWDRVEPQLQAVLKESRSG